MTLHFQINSKMLQIPFKSAKVQKRRDIFKSEPGLKELHFVIIFIKSAIYYYFNY